MQFDMVLVHEQETFKAWTAESDEVRGCIGVLEQRVSREVALGSKTRRSKVVVELYQALASFVALAWDCISSQSNVHWKQTHRGK